LADLNQRFLDGIARYHELREEAASVIPLLLEDLRLPLGLEAKVSLRAVTQQEREQALARLVKECKGTPPPPAPEPQCPYPGMAPFRTEDEPFFHGRARETDDLVQRLKL
jgi:hypothetical protein